MRAIIAALLTSLLFAGSAHAHMGPGPAEPGTAIACYNPATGEIIVSVNGVAVWYVESATQSLTGAHPPIINGGGMLQTDNDMRTGQSRFGGTITFVDYELGPVAATGLPLSDLSVWFNVEIVATPIEGQMLLCVPEPASLALIGMAAAVACFTHVNPSRRLTERL